MSIAERVSEPLINGQKLSREEFMRRWEALPEVKFAELLEGVVYVPSPVSYPHGAYDMVVAFWLCSYAGSTPGCEGGSNSTWLMLEDAPQPDCFLRLLPGYGGQSLTERYLRGTPELAVEVALSSLARDLGPKLRLYRAAGVKEFITVLVEESRVIWRRLVSGEWSELDPGPDSLLPSTVFPGLWLDPAALLARDIPRLSAALNQGLQSAEHREFVRKLLANRL